MKEHAMVDGVPFEVRGGILAPMPMYRCWLCKQNKPQAGTYCTGISIESACAECLLGETFKAQDAEMSRIRRVLR